MWYNTFEVNMVEFQLLPNGDISGYKTDFVKALVNDTTDDKVYMKYIGPTIVAFCVEKQVHTCAICHHKVYKFAEISAGNKVIICQDCSKILYSNFEELT